MDWLTLPAPESDRQPAFTDAAGARRWLAAQPMAQPLLMQSLLNEQLAAVDAAKFPPPVAVELLKVLHTAIIPVQISLEVRFTRKALPMANEEERIFAASHGLWTRLGIAYLRLAPHFAPKDKCPLLFRAANAFRLAQFAHFQACRECPVLLDQLLFSVLAQGTASSILRQAYSDPDFRHFGEANIAGLLSWAFLLRLSNPHHLTAAQLVVANRAISRWRELCEFQMDVDHSQASFEISLIERFATSLPDGIPVHLNIHPIIRKIRSRIVSLRAGASPESLKLGRELSGSACIRLLDQIEQQFRPSSAAAPQECGEIVLAFGAEHAYAVFRGELLNPDAPMDPLSESLSNQRMALFGFDQMARMPTAVPKLEIPAESWTQANGKALREASAGPRRLAPCLISAIHSGRPQLGILHGLLGDATGKLSAIPDWFTGTIEACRLQQPGLRDTKQARIAVFLLEQGGQLSLVLPNNAPIRPGIGLAIEGNETHHLVPTEVVDRGVDFIRYACRAG